MMVSLLDSLFRPMNFEVVTSGDSLRPAMRACEKFVCATSDLKQSMIHQGVWYPGLGSTAVQNT